MLHYGISGLPQQCGRMHGEKERSSLVKIWRHVGLHWIQERISNEDEIRLQFKDIDPRIAKQDILQSIDIAVGNGDGKLCPVQHVPERMMGLIT